MAERKRLQDLTIKNNFMFGAVMCDETNCKGFLESIFLSTRGENEGEVSQALVNFLHFVKADLAESEEDFQDEFVSELQKYIKHIKESREMGERFMLFEELLKDERAEGRAEGRREALTDTLISLLEEKGTVPEKLKEKIASESSTENLGNWIKLAAKLQSVEQFFEEM